MTGDEAEGPGDDGGATAGGPCRGARTPTAALTVGQSVGMYAATLLACPARTMRCSRLKKAPSPAAPPSKLTSPDEASAVPAICTVSRPRSPVTGKPSEPVTSTYWKPCQVKRGVTAALPASMTWTSVWRVSFQGKETEPLGKTTSPCFRRTVAPAGVPGGTVTVTTPTTLEVNSKR